MTTRHGAPDWANVAPLKVVHPLFDLGELAARLGGINVYDRRGYVIFQDDFRNGLAGWEVAVSGTGANYYLDVITGRFGPYALMLKAGSDGARSAIVRRYLHLPVLTKLGLEWHHTWDNVLESLNFKLDVYTGTWRHQVGLRWWNATHELQVRTSALTWEPIATVTLPYQHFRLFAVTKLVVDFEAGEYDRVLFNDQTYDASGNSYYSTSDATAPHAEAYLQVVSQGTFNAQIWAGGMILTQDEP